jgi:hypothetical protein
MLTLLLAAIGILHPARRYVIWFAGLIIFGIAATFGIEPIHSLLIHTPLVKGLKNERLILLADFALAALAGFGISVVGKKRQAWLLTGGALIAALYCIHVLQLATAFKVEVLRRPSFSRTLLIAGSALMLWRLIRGARATWFPIAACALLVFDLGTFAFRYTGFARTEDIFPPAPVFEFLKTKGDPYSFRVAQTSAGAAASNSASYYGLQSATGYEAIVPDRLQQFTADFSENAQPYISFIGEKTAALKDRRLDLLNLKYIVVATRVPDYAHFRNHSDRFEEVFHQGHVAVFENKTVLPRAFLVGPKAIVAVSEPDIQLNILKSDAFDPRFAVVVEESQAELFTSNSPRDVPWAGIVQITSSSPNRHVFRTNASTPAVLVVSQNPYPGWKASVDGASTSIFPADYALTGIAVPAGAHEVTLVLDPTSFKLGAVISLLSLLIFIGLCTIFS